MKKLLLFSFLLLSLTAISQVTISPNTFEVTSEITITVDLNSTATDCNSISSPNKVYMHSGAGNDADAWGIKTIGNWGVDDGIGEMTNNNNGTWSITITPSVYYSLTTEQQNESTKMGMVFRNASGNQELKASGCSDFFFDIGSFQLFLNMPTETTTILNAGETLPINATSSTTADFTLLANNISVDIATGVTTYTNNYIVNETTTFELQITDGIQTQSKTFEAIVTPTVTEAALPTDLLDGINYNEADNTKATLVLYAPGKQFVHVIGDFNDWTIDDAFLMKKDSSKDRFWIELTGLTPQTNHMYQYMVDASIRIADPYSPVVLAESNDQYINAVTYPDLPAYPTGKTNHSVTLLRTGDATYNWQTTNFTPPEKTDLVIYELLLRDFDALHSFDALKSRLDYIENLGINAIELMPLNEFDGNESWGYNPSFHMALDKYYGTQNAFKALVDECHRRGIAIIVDVVFNHASGQNPYYRLWNTDNGNYGGTASADNPFFNQTAKHAYGVFNDFNHSETATRDYVKRVTQFWIDEYNIDGFRWDLTKGFTQNCTENNESCTGSYQQDRVDVLKLYADYQWDKKDDFYIIFEHLGGITEESEWANYRVNEGKGIMLWNNLNGSYSDATMGFFDNGKSNFGNVSYKQKGFAQATSSVSYMESHDEERMMYRNLNFGASNTLYNVKDLNTALKRVETAGAFFFTVPGPKMIWQFGELGYDISIDENGRVGNKPILWDYLDDVNRKSVHDTWRNLIRLKLEEPIFKTSNFEVDTDKTSGVKSIHLTLDSATADDIKYITILGNFGITAQNIIPDFQQTGTWYNLLDRNMPMEVSSTTASITLKAGEFIIFGDKTFITPEDLDSDGVLNDNDICNDTPIGATVDANGCEVFSLPANNFKLQIGNETCRNSNNGFIDISAEKNLNYTAKITGSNLNSEDGFTSSFIKDNLAAGNYNICITVEGQPEYEQCYNVAITEPENLSVLSRQTKGKNSVSLDMSGGSSYKITFNGVTTETSSSEIELPLQAGENKITVETDKICQGKFEESIFYGNEMAAFPNPISNNELNVYLGELQDEKATVEMYSILGKRVYHEETTINTIKINASKLDKGVYLLKVITKTTNKSFKIIKN
ncbi:alpha-amylase family glycosyl hydrolase [Algibacter sp. L4_22]|uniref:alpha-amylase family glycosyl hydrolase n=1 Tax=Algibacter sp. L4_22 TaxID=2942477 RepID=UPI00201B5D1F|nr:alpha-amylase family glycosyl hydrolase [Algibacter sp. L4_22]MCL5127319.1 alpha-amylase family glycosyl hydrolase [Algibacter sp. L4_22]